MLFKVVITILDIYIIIISGHCTIINFGLYKYRQIMNRTVLHIRHMMKVICFTMCSKKVIFFNLKKIFLDIK